MTVAETLPQLSDVPSEIIEQALDDLAYAERSPKFLINMDSWVGIPDNASPCEVCLAGAALMRREDIEDCLSPDPWTGREAKRLLLGSVPGKLRQKANFLNDLRCGYVHDALDDLTGSIITIAQRDKALTHLGAERLFADDEWAYENGFQEYEVDRAAWKRFLRKVARKLKEIGL